MYSPAHIHRCENPDGRVNLVSLKVRLMTATSRGGVVTYAVVKDADGRASLFIDGRHDMTGDDDDVDERLRQLYGTPESTDRLD